MRTIFNRADKEVKNKGIFAKKTYVIKKVQREFAWDIRNKVMTINDRLDRELKAVGSNLNDDMLDFIYSELTSNLLELELNINTIIVNFSRITGVRMKYEGGELEERKSFLRRGQIFFLLNSDTSKVYGQTLIYLEEELKSELLALELDLNKLISSFSKDSGLDLAHSINQEYFRINSDMNTIIDDINSAIDNIYANISSNRDMNINLSFLLISAFLSVILFFPEFNTMLNLKNQEISYEDKLDEIIYEKMVKEVDMDDLLDIKANKKDGDILELIEDEILKDIIKTNIDYENEKLEIEKNRIKIFVSILLIILLPFLIWLIFIVL